MRNLFARMYLDSVSGRVAVAAGVLAVCIPFAHFVGGPPPLAELQLVEGSVIRVSATNGLKGGMEVVLTTESGSGGEDLRYFANPGDSAAPELLGLSGKSVRAWVNRTYESRIYQLDSGQRRVIDYEVRRKQLTGDPNTLLIYFVAVAGVFVLLSIKRFGEERG